MAADDTPISPAEARRRAADTARAEATQRAAGVRRLVSVRPWVPPSCKMAIRSGRIRRSQIPFHVTQPIRPIIRHRASEHELLERIRAIWATDIALAKTQAAQIETRRAALVTDLLVDQDQEAAASGQAVAGGDGRSGAYGPSGV